MYKVFLVDDERIIREGISKLIDWKGLNLEFMGSAEDGESAYEQIVERRPDIVITDVMMPEMNGVELIQKVAREMPGVKFVIFSGYGEFDFASKAMQYGVKHYLLKPSDEKDITSVLAQLVDELDSQQSAQHLYNQALPKLKEQLLRDMIQNRILVEQNWQQVKQIFAINGNNGDMVRLALFDLRNPFDETDLFALSNIINEVIGEETVLASAAVNSMYLTLLRCLDQSEIISKCQVIQETFVKYYKIDLSFLVTEEDIVEHVSEMYQYAQGMKESKPKYSKLIMSVIDLIHQNLSNEQLNLHGLANESIFMNPHYLGKLFKKETNEYFQHYVTRVRIEKAKELICHEDEHKIYEVAERTGFGDNSQYFSQVFKKYTGYSPKQFKRKMTPPF